MADQRRLKGYADLADLSEDERIEVMADQITRRGLTAAVVVDDEPGKPERYTEKLEAKGCRVIDRQDGPAKGMVTLTVTAFGGHDA